MTSDCESEAPDRRPQSPRAGIPEAAPRRHAGRLQGLDAAHHRSARSRRRASRVLDEFHVLAADGEVVINEKIGGLQTMAKINSSGIARLATLAKAKRAAATRPTVAPKKAGGTYVYDAFVSHASEDAEDFGDPLVDELDRRGVTVWYDRDRMTYGDAIVQRMKDGLRDSRCGIIIASPNYFGKTFTTPELNVLLMRAFADESRKVTPIFYQMTGRELSEVVSCRSRCGEERLKVGVEPATSLQFGLDVVRLRGFRDGVLVHDKPADVVAGAAELAIDFDRGRVPQALALA